MDLQDLTVFKLDISVEDDKTKIVILFKKNGEEAEAVFYNATVINIDMFSLPHIVPFIIIEDNAEKGYQRDVRYYVFDYENESLSFYCEEYKIDYGRKI